MKPERRRWLTALGVFLATAIGGVVAFLLARRRARKAPAPEETPVSELSARLRQEAATQERRMRRPRPGHRVGRRRGRRPAVQAVAEEKAAQEPPPPAEAEGQVAEASPLLPEDGDGTSET